MDVARLLIEAGAAIDKARDNGRSPLLMASQDGHVEVVKTLLDSGADATWVEISGDPLGGSQENESPRDRVLLKAAIAAAQP